MHGGVKFYRGSAAAARSYLETDHSRADDYYLAEGSGVAERYVAVPDPVSSPTSRFIPFHSHGTGHAVAAGPMDGPTYERWVAGYDVATGQAKGRLRDDDHALRFVEVVVNGPKSWSLAAALHPEIADAYDAAQNARRRGDHRVGRAARDDARRPSRPTGPGPRREARGRSRPALHLARR